MLDTAKNLLAYFSNICDSGSQKSYYNSGPISKI